MKFDTDFCGKPISFEFNDLAQRTDKSVIVRYGETVVLVTLVIDEKKREGLDFTPLTVEYEERYYAAGKIYGSRFLRREGRPSQSAILNARLLDRTIRPLFPKHFSNGVQINALVLSFDPNFDPDLASILGASLVLSLSPIDWKGPVGCLRLLKKGKVVSKNPSIAEREGTEDAIAVFAGPYNKINMIEVQAQESKEQDIVDLAKEAIIEINKIIDFQKGIISQLKPEKKFMDIELNEEVLKVVDDVAKGLLSEQLVFSKQEDPSQVWIQGFKAKITEEVTKKDASLVSQIGAAVEQYLEEYLKKIVLAKKMRPDGRKFDEIRPIKILLDPLPKVHGSAIFMRGLTHTLSAVTLGSPVEGLMIKDIEFEGTKRFLHHYNFPNFSTHELGMSRSPGRREIGHGALAEKALEWLIPEKEKFPYTVRAVSEVVSSNGSTSMASTCSTSLALMVAGVPIPRNVGGISVGLMFESADKYEILTDIQGPEDHYGDMDFKVAGTSEGITAVQMDTKIDGITFEMFKQALKRATEARAVVLSQMDKAISKPSATFKDNVPRIKIFTVDPTKIGLIIGAGGRTINDIIEKSGAQVDIEDETVTVSGDTQESVELAESMIRTIIKDMEVGDVVKAKVMRVKDFGAIVGLSGGKTGLLHISEFKGGVIPRDLRTGSIISVKVKAIDEETGRIRLSLTDNQ